jgi:hypothetical protein
MVNSADKKLEKELKPVFAHENGHAVLAVLRNVQCLGIYFEKDGEEGRFCALFPRLIEGEDSRSDNRLVSAAGAAAELLVCGNSKSASPKQIQTLVQVWKQLRRWRG